MRHLVRAANDSVRDDNVDHRQKRSVGSFLITLNVQNVVTLNVDVGTFLVHAFESIAARHNGVDTVVMNEHLNLFR